MAPQIQIEAAFGGVVQRLTSVLIVPVLVPIQVNPPDIVTIEDDEFRIEMNNMKTHRRYLMKFDGSTYVIWKNNDGALVMDEVEA